MLNAKAKSESNAAQFHSFDYGFYYYIIFLKPRTTKIFEKSSGQSMGVKYKWKKQPLAKKLWLNSAVPALLITNAAESSHGSC